MTSETQQSWEQFTSVSMRLARLLRGAAQTLPKLAAPPAASATAAADAGEWREEVADRNVRCDRLPWWAAYHPAVSFRVGDREDRVD